MNARLAAVVAASSDAIVSYATDMTILTWNPAAERMFGYGAEEVIGQPMSVIVPPERAHEPADFFARLRAGETIRNLETVRMRRNGTRVPVRVNLAPITDADGTITGVSATLCDLSERQRAEERFRGLLESAPDPILGVNREGRIVFVNAQAEKVFGYNRADLLGRSIELLVPERYRGQHERQRADYNRAPTTRPMGVGLDLWARRRDGTMLPVEISLSPMTESDDPLVVAIVRDVTDRKRAEAEREKLLAEAEASLRVRAEAERMKDDLTNMVVHDLKNPVSGIVMSIQAAFRRRDELPARQQETLLRIDRTCQEMMRLIQNVLEISKMEEGKMLVAREAIVLSEIVDDVMREYAAVAEQTGRSLQVTIDSNSVVSADYALLKRVLVNLVVNAIRHSGSRDVRVEAARDPENAEVVIRVVDHGRGIPEEDQTRIFEKFASLRYGPSGEPSTDTGLGLPFCKLAVERMGGRIGLTSEAGAPTVFTVALPIHGVER